MKDWILDWILGAVLGFLVYVVLVLSGCSTPPPASTASSALTSEEWRQQCAPVPPCDPRFVAARCEAAGGTWRPAWEWGDEPACCEVYVACEPGLSRADCKALGGLWTETLAGACCEAPR